MRLLHVVPKAPLMGLFAFKPLREAGYMERISRQCRIHGQSSRLA
jgi:hypothetical protein